MNLLEIVKLRKVYGHRTVVDSVNIDLRQDEVVGLLGPNGAGKTTTFYMTIGLVKPDGGQILLNGEDITDEPIHIRAHKGLGYLPQETSIFRKLTVKQNVLAILETINMPQKEREARAMELLEELGIARLANQNANVLSGGEKRRLEIARALSSNPTFMMLDEPFAGVDPMAVSDIRDIIRHLISRGIGVLISDHSVRETLSVCDRAYIISAGRVVESGVPEVIMNSPAARKYYLGEDFRL